MINSSKTLFLAIVFLFILPGCVSLSQPSDTIYYYSLQYEPPKPYEQTVPLTIAVKRFSVAPEYNSSKIIYTDKPNTKMHYLYHRWRSNPGDLCTYYILRDIRHSDLFLGASDALSTMPTSLVLEGTVDEFYELDSEQTWYAVVKMTFTVLHTNEPDVAKQIVMQRSYREKLPLKEKNPHSLAEAMSKALKSISTAFLRDVHERFEHRIVFEQSPTNATSGQELP